MPFTNFDTIKQSSTNSCGAFALAAALENFGLAIQTNQAQLLNIANIATGYSQAGPVVSNANGAKAFAENIYQVTGNLLLNAPEATYQYSNPVGNMNPPSALVYIATLFGYSPNKIAVKYNNAGMYVFEAFSVTNNEANSLLDTEINLLNTLNNNQDMIIAGPVNYNNPPTNYQVHILLVSDGAHWIAANSTQLYDPGTGYVGAYEYTNDGKTLVSFVYNMGGSTCQNDLSGIWIELNANQQNL